MASSSCGDLGGPIIQDLALGHPEWVDRMVLFNSSHVAVLGSPGAFDADAVAFHAEPFADGAKLRASFGAYEGSSSEAAPVEPLRMARNDTTPVLVLFGPCDHVLSPDFDRMATTVFAPVTGPLLLRDCGPFVPWEAPQPW
jgi:pimeloyl-ACP methyl ester carboxylesterase